MFLVLVKDWMRSRMRDGFARSWISRILVIGQGSITYGQGSEDEDRPGLDRDQNWTIIKDRDKV